MIFRLAQIAVPFVWFGLIGGISFLESPLKFRTPNITIPLGLGIGRLIFFWLNKIEIGLAILLLVSFFYARPKNEISARRFRCYRIFTDFRNRLAIAGFGCASN